MKSYTSCGATRVAHSRVKMSIAGLSILAAFVAVPAIARAQNTQDNTKGYLRLEGGTANLAYNTLRYPNDSNGADYSLRPLLHTGDKGFGRVTFDYAFDKAQGVRLDYAPLRDSGTGTIPQTFVYQGQTFTDTQSTHAVYQFDNYRATYWLRLHEDARLYARAGVTVDVLNAKIDLSQSGQSAHFAKTLPVPLLYLAFDYRFVPGLKFSAEADGLAISQGHAVDLALRLTHPFTTRIDASLGLRTIEGEAKTGTFRNTARYNFATAGVGLRF